MPRWQSISIQANIVRPFFNKVTYGTPQGTPMVQLQIMMIPIKLGNINSTSLESRDCGKFITIIITKSALEHRLEIHLVCQK